MKKRWVSILLTLIISVAAMPAFSVFADSELYYRLEQTYENLETTDDFSVGKEELGVSDLSEKSKIKVVGSDFSLLGTRSLAINECDMRWDNLSLIDEKLYVGLTVRADAEFNNDLNISFTTLQPSANKTKYAHVDAFCVSENNEKILLKDSNNNTIAELEQDIRYGIYCEFSRGSDLYNIYVNDVLATENCSIGKKIYSVEDIQVNVKPFETANKPYVIIDNVCVFAKGKDLQKYSEQNTGEAPETIQTQIKENKNIRVFVNTTEIAMANAPISRKNTVYTDVEQLARCLGLTLTEDKANKKFVLANENVTAEAVIGSKVLKINGKEYTILNAPEKINGVIMVPLNFLSEVLNAKVWWDSAANTVVISLGEAKKDGLLKIIGGKLYMNAEPYYEISFNKADLFNKVLTGNSQSTENELKQLNELGVKSIRVFAFSDELSNFIYNESQQDKYFKAMDEFFDLCEKYEIKVVVCLGLTENYLLKKDLVETEEYVLSTETTLDLIVNSQSESRKNLYSYLEKFITRYKDRKSVLMWEIANETDINPDYSLTQLAGFYADCADKIREFDKVHLITGGDSIFKNEQGEEAFTLLNKKLDVISVHAYGLCDLPKYVIQAQNSGKVLYNGATNSASLAEGQDFYSDTKVHLNFIAESGVQLSHWWDFDFSDEEMIKLVSGTNKTLKDKYCVNNAEEENTTDAWENPSFQVVDSSLITDGMEFAVMASFRSKFIRFCILSGVTVAASLVCVILLTREKLKRKRTEEFV